jgi:hypothetical protein
MFVDYNYIVIGLIAILVCITTADHAVIEYKGDIHDGSEITYFQGTVVVDHSGGGTSLEIGYRKRDSVKAWHLLLNKEGTGELLAEDGSTSSLEVPKGFITRHEVDSLAGPLSEALELPHPGLEMKEDSQVRSHGRPGLYHFIYDGETVLTLLRHTDPGKVGAPRDATLKLDEDTRIRIKFVRVDTGEDK